MEGATIVHFNLHQGADGDWYLTLTAANGEPLMTSEGYVTRYNARRAARRWPDVPVVEASPQDQ